MSKDSSQQCKYKYIQDLTALDTCRPKPLGATGKGPVCTPLKTAAWEQAMQEHPDPDFVDYLVRGMRQGFRIGFNRYACQLKSAKSNMRSVADAPEVVQSYIAKELAEGRVVGPWPVASKLAEGVHVSRFGVIPKSHQPGKWRLIVDLSHPPGHSVNDGVDPDLCSLVYASVDQAASIILGLGHRSVLAKLDVASAYRIIPVHPEDQPLLGTKWRGEVYVDVALPFGLRSAPKIFSAVADGLEWILQSRGSCRLIHYLDDFLFMAEPGSEACKSSLELAVQSCAELGVPLAMEKLEGPDTSLTFLGIVIDTVKLELRLPEEKLRRLEVLMQEWHVKRSCKKKELLSLIGQLQHAIRIVKPGRPFLRRMVNLSMSVTELHHHIRLRAGFRSDLQWWSLFVRKWNGICMMTSLGRSAHKVSVTSDASGS